MVNELEKLKKDLKKVIDRQNDIADKLYEEEWHLRRDRIFRIMLTVVQMVFVGFCMGILACGGFNG